MPNFATSLDDVSLIKNIIAIHGSYVCQLARQISVEFMPNFAPNLHSMSQLKQSYKILANFYVSWQNVSLCHF